MVLPDTSGGLFILQEKNRDHGTLEEVLKVIDESTQQTGRNVGVAVPDDEFQNLSTL